MTSQLLLGIGRTLRAAISNYKMAESGAKRAKFDVDSEMFVEAVRSYPQLYDKTEPNYKDVVIKKTLWAAIGVKFGISGGEAEKKWRVQRDRYSKELKKKRDGTFTGQGTTGVYKPTWKLFTIMESILSRCASPNESTDTNVPRTVQSLEDTSFPDFESQVEAFFTETADTEVAAVAESEDDESSGSRAAPSGDCGGQAGPSGACGGQAGSSGVRGNQAGFSKARPLQFNPRQLGSTKKKTSTNSGMMGEALNILSSSAAGLNTFLSQSGQRQPTPPPPTPRADMVSTYLAHLDVRARFLNAVKKRILFRQIDSFLADLEEDDAYQ